MDEARLVTEAATVCLRPLRLSPEESVGIFELSIRPSHPGINLGDQVDLGLFRSDLERLVSLLRNHVADVVAGQAVPSMIFVPLELGFQLQLLGGEAEGPMDGYIDIAFSLRWRLQPGDHDVYYGFEASAPLPDIYVFCAGLDLFIELLTDD